MRAVATDWRGRPNGRQARPSARALAYWHGGSAPRRAWCLARAKARARAPGVGRHPKWGTLGPPGGEPGGRSARGWRLVPRLVLVWRQWGCGFGCRVPC